MPGQRLPAGARCTVQPAFVVVAYRRMPPCWLALILLKLCTSSHHALAAVRSRGLLDHSCATAQASAPSCPGQWIILLSPLLLTPATRPLALSPSTSCFLPWISSTFAISTSLQRIPDVLVAWIWPPYSLFPHIQAPICALRASTVPACGRINDAPLISSHVQSANA